MRLDRRPRRPSDRLGVGAHSHDICRRCLGGAVRSVMRRPRCYSRGPPSGATSYSACACRPGVATVRTRSRRAAAFPPVLGGARSSMTDAAGSDAAGRPVNGSRDGIGLIVLATMSDSIVVTTAIIVLSVGNDLISTFSHMASLDGRASVADTGTPIIRTRPVMGARRGGRNGGGRVSGRDVGPGATMGGRSTDARPTVACRSFERRTGGALCHSDGRWVRFSCLPCEYASVLI